MKTAFTLLLPVTLMATLGQASAQAAKAKWQALINNQMLTHSDNFGGAGVQALGLDVKSGATQTSTELHLCQDGHFMRIQKVTMKQQAVNAGGVNIKTPPMNNIEKAGGTWTLSQVTARSATVQLNPDSPTGVMGNDRVVTLSLEGKNILVKGERWTRARSPICN